MDRADREVNLRFVRQSFLREREFFQSAFVIALGIIDGKPEREMAFGQIWLELERAFGQRS